MLTSLLAVIAAAGIASAAPAVPVVNFAGAVADDTNSASYSIASVPIGTANANRRVILCIEWHGAAEALTDVEIGGITAEFSQNVAPGTNVTNAIAFADVPTGTTATVALDFANTVSGVIVQSYWSHTVDLVPLQISGNSQSTTTSFTWDHWPAQVDGFQLYAFGGFGTSGQGQASATFDGAALTKLGEENRESNYWGSSHLISDATKKIAAASIGTTNSGSKAWMGSAWAVPPPTPLWAMGVNSTTSTGATAFSLPGAGLGKPHANRLIIVALSFARTVSTETLTSATIGGVAATIAAQNTGSTLGAAIIYANVPNGEIGDISFTFGGIVHFRSCRVYRAVPASATPVDSGSITGAAVTSATLADLEVKDGGFVIVAGCIADDDPISCTWEGAEAVSVDFNWVASTTRQMGIWSILPEADATTLDVTLNATNAVNIRGVAVSWF